MPMKSFVASLLPVLAALTGCDHPFALVEDGHPAVEIVAPDDAQVRKDVDFFTNAVCRATRAAIPVVGRAGKGRCIRFLVSDERDVMKEDAYSVSFPDKRTMLVRGSPMSCRWALNRILEDDLGVVFCFPGPHGTHYPQTNALALARTPFAGDAALKFERCLWREDPDWTRALGGKVLEGNAYNHNCCNIFPIEKYAKDPWREKLMPQTSDGRRPVPASRYDRWQPCFSAPEAVTEAVKNICADLRRHPEVRVYSLSVNDNGGYCRCDRCKAANGGSLDRPSRYGEKTMKDLSPVYFTWANRVAEGVTKEFPYVRFGILAYGATLDPPPFRLHPNLMPFICGSVYQSHNAEVRERRLRQMKEWCQRTDAFGVWDYGYGARHYSVPRVYLKTVRDFLDLKRNEVPSLNAMFVEGSSFMGEGPKRYFYYKRMFDVNADADALLGRWYEACCGKEAAPHLRAYYDAWERFWTGEAIRRTEWYKSVAETYCNFNSFGYLKALTRKDLEAAEALMARAHEAAQRSGDADQRIRAERLYDFARYYTHRSIGTGALSDAAVGPDMFDSLDKAMEYAKKIARVKYDEPFVMSSPYVGEFLMNVLCNPDLVDWLNAHTERLGDPLRSKNAIFDEGLSDADELKLWRKHPEYGLEVESLTTDADGNRAIAVVGKPGWPGLQKLVKKGAGGVYQGFSARVRNETDVTLKVRLTFSPGTGTTKTFEVPPKSTRKAELVGMPVNKDINYFVIFNGIPSGGRAVVDQLVLRPLDPRNDAF